MAERTVMQVLQTRLQVRPFVTPDEYTISYPPLDGTLCEQHRTPPIRIGITEWTLGLEKQVTKNVTTEHRERLFKNPEDMRHIVFTELVTPTRIAFRELGTAFTVQEPVALPPTEDNREDATCREGPDADFVFHLATRVSILNQTASNHATMLERASCLAIRLVKPGLIDRAYWKDLSKPCNIDSLRLGQQARKLAVHLGCPHIILYDGHTLVHLEFLPSEGQADNYPADAMDPKCRVRIEVAHDHAPEDDPRCTVREALYSATLESIKRAACEVLTKPAYDPPRKSFTGTKCVRSSKNYMAAISQQGERVLYQNFPGSVGPIQQGDEFLVQSRIWRGHVSDDMWGLPNLPKKLFWARQQPDGSLLPISRTL